MATTRSRQNISILPRVKDLELSQQWTSLSCDINDLERLNARTKTRRSPTVTFSNTVSSRPSNRFSMPEALKPDLVNVHMTTSEDVRCSSGITDRWSWKPRTDFEKNYFTEMEISSVGNDSSNYSSHQRPNHHEANELPSGCYENSGYQNFDSITKPTSYDNHRNLTSQRPRSSGYNIYDTNLPQSNKNERRKTCNGSSSFYYESPRVDDVCPIEKSYKEPELLMTSRSKDYYNANTKYTNNKPHSVAHHYSNNEDDSGYRGSRERLHEIFEHNRQLRRQFFASAPSSIPTNQADSIEEKNRPCDISNETTTMRNRLEFQKLGGSGFGSTETLTSQSNQSGGSSTNGRKSGVDFGNSPEPPDDSRIFTSGKFVSRHSKNVENLGNEVDAPSTFSQSSKLSMIDSPISQDHESLTRDSAEPSRRIPERQIDRLKESLIENFTTKKNSQFVVGSRGRTDSLDSDQKFFATYVNIQDSSSDSSKISSPTIDKSKRRTKVIPPPLDLSRVDQRYGDRYDKERRLLKNYTVEVTPLQDYDRPSHAILTVIQNESPRFKRLSESDHQRVSNSLMRGSKSLVELSANLSRSPSTSLTRISKIDGSKNTLCSRLSATVDDLRSPQLVNNFSNSVIDLIQPSEREEIQLSSGRENFYCEHDQLELSDCVGSSPDSVRRKSIVSTTPGTGTTLPLVYGPIPYSQYLQHSLFLFLFFLVFSFHGHPCIIDTRFRTPKFTVTPRFIYVPEVLNVHMNEIYEKITTIKSNKL